MVVQLARKLNQYTVIRLISRGQRNYLTHEENYQRADNENCPQRRRVIVQLGYIVRLGCEEPVEAYQPQERRRRLLTRGKDW
jgi:hypothetical protein